MQFVERDEGDYRICAEATGGQFGEGYVAAVVIRRVRGDATPAEAFREASLAGGYHWPSPESALVYALGKGRELIVEKRYRLAC
ncbi:hypothetical protein [Piscinibacter sp. XHJ-5]|uniref:hypothetical protein n=1 Tax=Piscinibacter sp. XHJ-5 TaxID=3037797 RepID=UPI002452A962|nr:hypothetical protein [Piscinibacter sp. XHJ-5]